MPELDRHPIRVTGHAANDARKLRIKTTRKSIGKKRLRRSAKFRK